MVVFLTYRLHGPKRLGSRSLGFSGPVRPDVFDKELKGESGISVSLTEIPIDCERCQHIHAMGRVHEGSLTWRGMRTVAKQANITSPDVLHRHIAHLLDASLVVRHGSIPGRYSDVWYEFVPVLGSVQTKAQ